jgi:hypothetical protein
MQKHFVYSLLTVLTLTAVSCDKSPLEIPTTYTNDNFTTNAQTELGIRTQLETFVAEAKKGRTAGTVVDYTTLSALFTGDLQQATTTYYAGRLEGDGQWIKELTLASGNTYQPGIPTGQGGQYNGYLFDENGLELEQLLDKGLFGAALYNRAAELMRGEVTVATVDQILALYGAHPDFPNTPTAGKADNPDKFMAGYAARRDKNDGNGLYSQMETHFLTLRAAVESGKKYNSERDEALANIRLTWEKINSATIINYCHSIISILSATGPTDADKARALHAYSECVGFLHGWLTLPTDDKALSDDEIKQLLQLLNAPADGVPTSYRFVTDPVNTLPQIQQVIQTLQTKFGFTAQEVEDFKKNWVTEQGR